MLNLEPTAEDVQRAMRRLKDDEARLKKTFYFVKQLSFEKFRRFMCDKHTTAHEHAIDEMRQAMGNVLTSKQIQQVEDEYRKVRQEWDNITEIAVSFEEFDFYDLIDVVSKEMKRAARIHGETFTDYQQAKEAILEEVQEVFAAHEDEKDIIHAKSEALQAIGTLIKYIRTVEK